MPTVHTETLRGYTIEIHDDNDAEHANPRQDDNLGVMVCQHPRYRLGDTDVDRFHQVLTEFMDRFDGQRGVAAFVRWLRIFHGTTAVLPLYLHDHSGITMRAGADLVTGDDGQPLSRRNRFVGDSYGWDTSTVGFIFDTAATRELIGTPPEAVAEVLKGEVETYALYLEGNVYGYRILDAEGDAVEACWGFVSESDGDVLDAARAEVPEEPAPAPSSKFRLGVTCPADGFDRPSELPDALRRLADRLDATPLTTSDSGVIRDVNGNTIGNWTFTVRATDT